MEQGWAGGGVQIYTFSEHDLIVNHIAWYQNEVFTKSFVLGGWNRAMTQ